MGFKYLDDDCNMPTLKKKALNGNLVCISGKTYYEADVMISNDGYNWYRTGEVVPSGYESDTDICNPIYRWVNMNINTDYICSGYSKYYKQRKQISWDSGATWSYVVPAEYQRGALYETDSTDCGYVPVERIYKWENMNINTDYWCEDMNKYYKQRRYYSDDDGITWIPMDEYRKGALYQEHSTDCGYIPVTADGWLEITYHTTNEWYGNQQILDNTNLFLSDVAKMYVDGLEITKTDTYPMYITEHDYVYKFYLYDNVTDLKPFTFSEREHLTKVDMTNLSSGLTEVGESCFYKCYDMTGLTFSDYITEIDATAFGYCSKLRTIDFKNIEYIGVGAFSNCSLLTEINLGDSMYEVDDYAFSGCYSCYRIYLNNGLHELGSNILDGCVLLSSIYCNSNLPPLATSTTFEGLSSLEYVYVPNGTLTAYGLWQSTSPSWPGSYPNVYFTEY